MVCNKCQKLSKGTTLATPGVKKKSEMYYGSPASSSSSGTKSATLGQTGIGKSKLLSKNAKNPYAQYSSSCTKCKTKISQGHSYCNKCAYQANSKHPREITELPFWLRLTRHSLCNVWEV